MSFEISFWIASEPVSSLRGHLFSIAPHAPFLTTLADRIIDGTLLGDWPRTGHFWLSETPEVVGSKGWDAALPRVATWVKLTDKTDISHIDYNWSLNEAGK